MSGVFLTQWELEVLKSLEDRRARTSIDISRSTDIPNFAVRPTLRQLRRCRFVQRGGTIRDVGRWWITDAGSAHLQARNQLELIR